MKRPSLDTTSMKKPEFLGDLGQDLRDLHLWPLVALIAVAIVAAPFVLGAAEPDLSETTGQSGIAIDPPAKTSETIVVANSPGLRDYKQRLSNLTASDPFKQQFSSVSVADEGGTTSEENSVPFETTTSEGFETLPDAGPPTIDIPGTGGDGGGDGGGGSGTGDGGDDGGGGGGEIVIDEQFASHRLDVRIVRPPAGKGDKAKVDVRKDLPELTMLPSRKSPVAIFMGVSSDGEKALLLISSEVESTFGDGRCVIGKDTCQLLALEPGLPQTFVYGPRSKTYRIEILRIKRVVTDEIVTAPLGNPSSGGQQGTNPAG